MLRTTGILIAIGLTAGLCPGVAEAGGRVAVLGVSGDQSGDVEDALAAMVGGEHEVVSSQAFERAADREGIKDLDTRGIARVAKKLSVDAVLEGVLSRDDEGYQLLVRVRTASGKTTKKLTIIMPGKQLSAKARRSLGDRLLVAIDDMGASAGSGRRVRDEPVDDEPSARDAKRRPDRDDDRPARDDDRRADRGDDHADRDDGKRRADRDDGKRPAAREDDRGDRDGKRRADRDDDRDDRDGKRRADRDARDDRAADDRAADDRAADDRAAGDRDRVAIRDDDRGDSPDDRADRDDRDDRDDGLSARASHGRSRPVLAAIVEAGASVTGRSLKFTSRANFDQAPDGYTGPYVPGARVAGAIYPLAFTKAGGAAAGLGLDFEYDQTLSLTTRTSAAMDIAMPTTEKHWVVGARYRISFGQRASAPSITLGAGYGRRVFMVDRSGLPAGVQLDLPDVDYRFIAPSVGLRLPIGGRVTLTADGRALLFRKAGAIQNPDQYGGAKVTGGDGQLGLEVAVTPRVVVHLSGYGTMIGFDFVGNGAASNNRDNDATTQDVGGALDKYVGGAIALGVAY